MLDCAERRTRRVIRLRVAAIDPADPAVSRLRSALEVLQEGGLVALPTETFYGLAADAFNRAALAQLNRLKQKPSASPILLLLAETGQVQQLAEVLPEEFAPLAGAFWPGPLTLVIRARPSLPPEVSAGRGTVAIRVPGLALPRRLAALLGRPISGVSANVHGQAPCRKALEVAQAFPQGIELILDGGPAPGGAPSTIVDLSDRPARLLREGMIPRTALTPFLPGLSKT